MHMHAERKRMEEERIRKKNWKRWGPYVSGIGFGASHQTGWTGLFAKLLLQSGD